MKGRITIGGLFVITILAGAAMYYLQVYANYTEVDSGAPVRLTSIISGEPEPILAEDLTAIDATTSPIRYRGCFRAGSSLGMLTETYQIYDEAVPLHAPGWFDCFDAEEVGSAIEDGSAVAFLGQKDVTYGVDRIVAVMADGRGFTWNQLNPCGEALFSGDDLPMGCPPAPERSN